MSQVFEISLDFVQAKKFIKCETVNIEIWWEVTLRNLSGDEFKFHDEMLSTKIKGAKGGSNIISKLDFSFSNVTPSI